MVEKLLFSLLSTVPTQNEFIRGGSLNQIREGGQEAAAQDHGIEMSAATETVITGGEVAVEVGIGMTVTGIVGGMIDAEAGAAVPVLIIIEAVVEADMMTGRVGVDQLTVCLLFAAALVLGGVILPTEAHLPGVQVLIGAAVTEDHQLLLLFLLVVELLLVLEVL